MFYQGVNQKVLVKIIFHQKTFLSKDVFIKRYFYQKIILY